MSFMSSHHREPLRSHDDRLAYLVHEFLLDEIIAIGTRTDDYPDCVLWCNRSRTWSGLPSMLIRFMVRGCDPLGHRAVVTALASDLYRAA